MTIEQLKKRLAEIKQAKEQMIAEINVMSGQEVETAFWLKELETPTIEDTSFQKAAPLKAVEDQPIQ